MKTTWKYELELPGGEFSFPAGGQVLAVQMQHGVLCLWVLVESENPLERRRFEITGTGHPVPEAGRYVGTVQERGGMLVWHVWEVPK